LRRPDIPVGRLHAHGYFIPLYLAGMIGSST
jgi:hypothetical protein